MKKSFLPKLMVLDAAVLLLLGAVFIFCPRQVEMAFRFKDLPVGVDYILGLWGCVLVTLGMGYAVASLDPVRNLIWAQMAIARGALECLLGLAFLARGTVTCGQACFGIVLAALVSIAYLICYPRKQTSETAKPA
jgi:hypothetical protein